MANYYSSKLRFAASILAVLFVGCGSNRSSFTVPDLVPAAHAQSAWINNGFTSGSNIVAFSPTTVAMGVEAVFNAPAGGGNSPHITYSFEVPAGKKPVALQGMLAYSAPSANCFSQALSYFSIPSQTSPILNSFYPTISKSMTGQVNQFVSYSLPIDYAIGTPVVLNLHFSQTCAGQATWEFQGGMLFE